ncbi:MAG: ethanolamine utilization protein EutJ [Arachnia sp.]
MTMTLALDLPTSPAARLARFEQLVGTGEVDPGVGEPRLGIDLGTANIVASVVDQEHRPVAGAWGHSEVVRDGVVVDWAGATSAVRALVADVERRLGHQFTHASVSVPPAISSGDTQVFVNVAHAAGLDVAEIVDEPVAAARALGLADGCVIDIGHGTTGVSILRRGAVIRSVDEPTGGHHMALVLAGARGLSYEHAEELKKDPAHQREIFGTIRPTLEKMASIAAQAIAGFDVDNIFLVGGASSFPDAPEVFAARLARPVTRPAAPLFVTPLGIPMRGAK